MLWKIWKWPRIQDFFLITPKIKSVLPFHISDNSWKFHKNPSITFWVILNISPAPRRTETHQDAPRRTAAPGRIAAWRGAFWNTAERIIGWALIQKNRYQKDSVISSFPPQQISDWDHATAVQTSSALKRIITCANNTVIHYWGVEPFVHVHMWRAGRAVTRFGLFYAPTCR